MSTTSSYDDIRAYYDDEIPAAMERLAADPMFESAARFVFPDKTVEEARATILACRNIDQVQHEVMYYAIKRIIDTTITRFTASGAENVPAGRGWLFVSNHRDIVLDAFLQQYALFMHSLPTSDITFGDNLMSSQFVIDIGRSNKMFKVIRKDNIPLREFLANSRHLSEYIRLRIGEGNSVWIAQRNGRTKDGLDATDQGLLKMFSMSGEDDFEKNLGQLHIAPMSISYEYEPCDIFKTAELAVRQSGVHYVKGANEDFESIMSGIMSPKGNVHITLCRPISEQELHEISLLPKSEAYKALAELIDRRIYEGYQLHATNYIAHDILHESDRHAEHYTPQQREAFVRHMRAAEEKLHKIWDTARPIFLGIYANPVDTKI